MNLPVTIDLSELTINIENVTGLHTCNVCIRKAQAEYVYNILAIEGAHRKDGPVTWIKFFDMQLHPQNGFDPKEYIAFVWGLDVQNNIIAEGVSEPFSLNPGQISFIKDRLKKPSPEPVVSTSQEVEVAEEETEGLANQDILTPPQVEQPEPAINGKHSNIPVTDESVQTPVPENSDNVSKAAAEEALRAQKLAFEAQLAELKTVHEEELASALKAKLAELEKAHEEEKRNLAKMSQDATDKLKEELASGISAASKENADIKLKLEQELARLEKAIADVQSVPQSITPTPVTGTQTPPTAAAQQAQQSTPPAPTAAAQPANTTGAQQTPTQTVPQQAQQTPAPTDEPTPANSDAAAQATNARAGASRFQWNPSMPAWLAALIVVLLLIAAGLAFWQNSPTLNVGPNDRSGNGNQAEIMRLMDENNRLKSGQMRASAAPVPDSGVLHENVTVNGTNVSVTLPAKARSDSGHSITIGQISGNQNTVAINDNRQTLVHPNGWPLDWKETLPTVNVCKEIQESGVYTFVLPPRGVQAILAPEPGWYVEVNSEDMLDADVKYGDDNVCLDYAVGPDNQRIKGNQIRIRPKTHQSRDVSVRVKIVSPQDQQLEP